MSHQNATKERPSTGGRVFPNKAKRQPIATLRLVRADVSSDGSSKSFAKRDQSASEFVLPGGCRAGSMT
ncbi:hypothetical protein BH789_gp023 [Gordonia phage GMA6]|uniref:Uncharacterized protein n=1 Tax=Gordonia phage GMA6 TaxID=1647285 RepID=A0A0K0NL36_9CAUD|nr:hypothetical protein BH789_gp023 [Gordonia phage GMA6]AKL88304.1 hypothetical protein GMA6_23 [Gordonia phage GMA6]